MSSEPTEKKELVVQKIQDTVPDGIAIKPTPYGFGLFATKLFPAKSVVYEGRAPYVIPNEPAKFLLQTNQGDFETNTDTHSVLLTPDTRELYLFDGFMNHSCDPSTRSDFAHASGGVPWATVALRDIEAGEEITCDYNLFEYDIDGHEIEQCQCGSPKCLGAIKGFKHLSLAQQRESIATVWEETIQPLVEDPAFLYAEVTLPSTLTLGEGGVVSTRAIELGDDVAPPHPSQALPQSVTEVILKVGSTRVWLAPGAVVSCRGNGGSTGEVGLLGLLLGHFGRESSPPNVRCLHRGGQYSLVAVRSIEQGEPLVCETRDAIMEPEASL